MAKRSPRKPGAPAKKKTVPAPAIVTRRKRPGTRPARRGRDVAILLHPTEDHQGFQVLRQRAANRPLELGTVRPLREGQPIDGEVVSLRPRPEAPFAFDVKVEVPEQRLTGDGPPQVATESYRRG